MGRVKGKPKLTQIILIPEELMAELYLLRPELLDHKGNTKYGAISKYFETLMRQDLEALKEGIRSVAGVGATT